MRIMFWSQDPWVCAAVTFPRLVFLFICSITSWHFSKEKWSCIANPYDNRKGAIDTRNQRHNKQCAFCALPCAMYSVMKTILSRPDPPIAIDCSWSSKLKHNRKDTTRSPRSSMPSCHHCYAFSGSRFVQCGRGYWRLAHTHISTIKTLSESSP